MFEPRCDPGPIHIMKMCSGKDKTSTNTFVSHIFCGLWLIWIIVLSYYMSVIFWVFLHNLFSLKPLLKIKVLKGFSFPTEMPKKNCFWITKVPFSDRFFRNIYIFFFYLKNLFHFKEGFVEWKDLMDAKGSSLNHQ